LDAIFIKEKTFKSNPIQYPKGIHRCSLDGILDVIWMQPFE